MEKRKRKNHKSRVLILLIALFFTTVLFTTSSYAWFTANKTVTVSNLSVNVEAQNGIQISADGSNWKSIVQVEDLKGVHANTYTTSVNQIPTKMDPVSTIGVIDNSGHMEMYKGVVEDNATGDYILTATKQTDTEGTSGSYIAFDLFFKVNMDTDLYLTTNSGVVTTDQTDTGIKNAARMGFVVLGHADDGTSTTAQIQALNAGSSALKYIWEPNYNAHTASAVQHANDVYGETITEGTNNSRLAYVGVKAPIAATDNVLVNTQGATGYLTDHSDFFGNVTIDYDTVAAFSAKKQIFGLEAGITKVRIYMWIEGQDVDCENSASNGNIDFKIQLTTE
jgi:hypothetical protein